MECNKADWELVSQVPIAQKWDRKSEREVLGFQLDPFDQKAVNHPSEEPAAEKGKGGVEQGDIRQLCSLKNV
jgi:hypothetical protein